MRKVTPLHRTLERVDTPDGRRVEVGELLGKGSASSVYRARVESRDGIRRVGALKIFAAASSDDIDEVIAELRRTAQRAAQVRHPNVVGLEDFGIFAGQPFFMNELVEGVTLQALMDRYAERQRRMPLDIALFIASEVIEGLSGARTARDDQGVQLGMLHLGLAPREVLLSWRGEVKVSDFEINTARTASSSVRSLRTVARRANTMAPEVAQGLPGDARSDVFSMGVLLRELFVGPRFPRGLGHTEAARLAREGFIQTFSFQPHLPEALVAIVDRALELAPQDRYPNATAMAYDLRRVALAMGAADGRWFLRRLLDHEWGTDAEVTRETPLRSPRDSGHPADE